MSRRISDYYVTAHNSAGKCNLLSTNINSLSRIVAIKCDSKIITTMIISKIYNEILDEKHDIELIHDPLNNKFLIGVIDIIDGLGVISADLLCNDNAIYNEIDVNLSFDSKQDKVTDIQKEINDLFNNAYDYFRQAKQKHDEWESIYIKNIDFKKADEIIELTSNQIISSVNFEKKACIRERFFGSISANGATNYVKQIINRRSSRFFIKGRPGTSKSTMLKHLAKLSEKRGIDADIYHCASDIDSLDMVDFPELDTCIFDSTAPHEFFPARDNDIVIDMYTALLPENFDEANRNILTDIQNRYKTYVNNGISVLSNIMILHDQIENLFINTLDFDNLAGIYEKIVKEIVND